MQHLRKSLRTAIAVTCSCNLSPYLLAYSCIQVGEHKQVIVSLCKSDNNLLAFLESGSYFCNWGKLFCTTLVCWGMPMKKMTEKKCIVGLPTPSVFILQMGSWSTETMPCPGSCRKCFRNDSILFVVGQLHAPLYSLHRSIMQNMLATGDSNQKYSPPAFYKMHIDPKEFTQIDESRLK